MLIIALLPAFFSTDVAVVGLCCLLYRFLYGHIKRGVRRLMQLVGLAEREEGTPCAVEAVPRIEPRKCIVCDVFYELQAVQ